MAAKTQKTEQVAATATPAEASPAIALVPGLQLSKGAILDFEREIAALDKDEPEGEQNAEPEKDANLPQDKPPVEPQEVETDEDGFPIEEAEKEEKEEKEEPESDK